MLTRDNVSQAISLLSLIHDEAELPRGEDDARSIRRMVGLLVEVEDSFGTNSN